MGNAILVAKAGRAFDKVRKRFFSPWAELKLLKPSATARDYETLAAISTAWFFDSERNEAYIAREAFDLQDVMDEATHLQIEDGDIYVIAPDDTKAPDTKEGGRAYWTIVCEKFASRTQYRPLY